MQELVEALKKIKEECEVHSKCIDCPMSKNLGSIGTCLVKENSPRWWKINEKPHKALL